MYMAEKEERQVTTTSDDDGRRDDDVVVVDPDDASFSTTCLRLRMRKINMVHYDGNKTQRTLALSYSPMQLFLRDCVWHSQRSVFGCKLV